MSGWTAATLNVSDDETRERLDQELRDTCEGHPPWGAGGYADTTVQVERGVVHETVAKKLANEFPEAEYIAVISANDTSMSGRGTLFRVTLSNDGSKDQRFNTHPVKEIDSMQGYEGATGNDVTGYFSQEHGIRSYSSFEA